MGVETNPRPISLLVVVYANEQAAGNPRTPSPDM